MPTSEKRAACVAARAEDPTIRCRCPRVDTSTRYQGTYARHQRACALTHDDATRCSCTPKYWSRGYDPRTQRMVRTRMMATVKAARDAARDLTDALEEGATPTRSTLRFAHAVDQFLEGCRSGVVLNKHGRRYKPDAIENLDSALRGHAVPEFGTWLFDAPRRGDVQRLVDKLMTTAPKTAKLRDRSAQRLSGSRIRSIVNAIHSLYRWGILRDLAEVDPAQLVLLPALDATPRVEIAASPADVAKRLAALPLIRTRGGRYRARPLVVAPGDRLPFALAVYAGARRAEIRTVAIADVDLEAWWIFLGVDEAGRKTKSAQRGLPIIAPLRPIILEALMQSGRRDAAGAELLCPGDRVRGRNSGMLSFEALQTRADRTWEDAGIERFTAHMGRHIFASWLDAAGVRPVVASQLLGHSTTRQRHHDGAALVTQRVYTHPLAGELADGMRRLEAFIHRKQREALAL